MKDKFKNKVTGALMGMAVGDAIGLPREKISRRRAESLFGNRPLRHRFLLGRGMISDDTEHACITVQSLLVSGGDPKRFSRSLAWRLRFWLLGMPAGLGMASLKGIGKLWLGFPPSKSGVNSAGNGPAMRSPVIGMFAGDDMDKLKELVHISTQITHTDERAYEGALAVAIACNYAIKRDARQVSPTEYFALLKQHISNKELCQAMDTVEKGIKNNHSASEIAKEFGLENGVSGYMVHTAPMAIFCWLRYRGDFRTAIEEIIMLGGDADTTAAITGAMAGAELGNEAIPQDWQDGLLEFPRSQAWMHRLADRFSLQISTQDTNGIGTLKLFWPGIIIRNIVFTTVVLLHGFRRMFPPYR